MGVARNCCALLLLISLGSGICSTHARTWDVPSECTTIHAGLDSASSGDTVLVAPDIYPVDDDPESWIAPGPDVCLRSEEGPEVTIIEVCDTAIGILLMDCEGACVSGFTLRFGSGPGCGYPSSTTKGIQCYDCTKVTVENCIIEHFNYGIIIQGTSSKCWLPVVRNSIIRNCSYGINCFNVLDPGRPFFEDNIITECGSGAWIHDSSPMFYGNEITHCRYYGLRYGGHCGGNCDRNIIAHNDSIGVNIYADPPLAAPGFNGGLVAEDANDFFDNGSYHILYRHSGGPGAVVAMFNYWGSDCPDSSEIFSGNVTFSPWVDSTHTQVLNEDDCSEATEPSTWGSIKAVFQ